MLNFPAKPLVSKWLKAGYVDNRVFHDSSMGTPQGEVISPLLANIALNGLEKAIGIKRSKRGEVKSCLLYTSPSPRDRQKSRMPSSA